MKINKFSTLCSHLLILAGGVVTMSALASSQAHAQIDMKKRPSLVITSESTPSSARSAETTSITPMAGSVSAAAPVYAKPVRTPDITSAQITGDSYYQETNTVVAGKVSSLRTDLSGLQSRVNTLGSNLKAMQDRSQSMSAEYNASVATINTQLQTGTTPGNPRLVQRLSTAQGNLDRMSQNVADLNSMAVEAANAASMASYLLEATRSAYGLSGAVEEDHVALSQLEDQVSSTIMTVDRLLNQINDDITRTAAYLSAERGNLRTLSLAVTKGDYYGPSLANRPFSSAPPSTLMQPASYGGGNVYQSAGGPAPAPLTAPRPLVKIKFDQPNVDYEQAVYMAVNEAKQKYPNARLEVIAVHPSQGNAAQVAIESTRSRRNAESVLRSLSQMGINTDTVDLSTQSSAEASTNEVHIFIH
jgi:hypothetical protein